MNSPIRASLNVSIVAAVLLLQACATPSEIKAASQNQLELIDSLDSAVAELQDSIDRFYRDHSDLVRIEGRMEIARAAVEEATEARRKVSADELFEMYEAEVRPWIQHANTMHALDAAIADINVRIAEESDETQKLLLRRKLSDLRLLRSNAAGQTPRPESVAQIDEDTRETISRNAKTDAKVMRNLKILRAQIALMKLMQSRVDTWLSIDVSPSQEQVDGLTKSIRDARDAMKGEGP